MLINRLSHCISLSKRYITVNSLVDPQLILHKNEMNNEQIDAFENFPWFKKSMLEEYKKRDRVVSKVGWYMRNLLKNRECLDDFHILYREFHQWCAVPDFRGINVLCEKQFADHIKKSIRQIHLKGLQLEMTKIRAIQPKMIPLDFKIYKHLNVDRSKNGKESDYTIHKDRVLAFGPKCTVYRAKKQYLREALNVIEKDYKPYLLQVKVLIGGPMHLYTTFKSSKYLYDRVGEDETAPEFSENIVQFEINLKGNEFFRIIPVEMKPPLLRSWRITDINNALKGNSLFLN